MENENILEATTKDEMLECYPALVELRPHLTKETALVKIQTQQNEGYHLMYLKEQDTITSILGYRIINTLAWGKILYIDDLSTLPSYRNQGAASKLLDWSVKKAKSQGCEQLHLDTGFDRKDANRLYLKYNFNYNCQHMASIL